MSSICWNCRGLGNPCTVNTLQKKVLEEDPILVFIIETKFEVSEKARIKKNRLLRGLYSNLYKLSLKKKEKRMKEFKILFEEVKSQSKNFKI